MSRILTIEDSASVRLLLIRRLQRAGHRVDAAVGPREALARLTGERDQRVKPDLILLDLGFARDDAIAALPQIRQAAGDAPIVLVSARHDLDRLETPVEVAGRVPKPIDFDRLLELIEALTVAR